ncbi:hypothetical protein CHARACLAT_009391 [Characodon lateralis]|uniref:Uncharacterized protein n=1 Tax=Characodon lateralis TaxID=208331 RepID=A0ABU7DTD6_9TELE|nr:hypothetical protein [Characodon lateralis]
MLLDLKKRLNILNPIRQSSLLVNFWMFSDVMQGRPADQTVGCRLPHCLMVSDPFVFLPNLSSLWKQYKDKGKEELTTVVCGLSYQYPLLGS